MNFSIPGRMTVEELSVVLGISEKTVKTLAKNTEIPSFKEKNKLYFDFNEIVKHFRELEGEAL